jgi:hypothetical protein
LDFVKSATDGLLQGKTDHHIMAVKPPQEDVRTFVLHLKNDRIAGIWGPIDKIEKPYCNYSSDASPNVTKRKTKTTYHHCIQLHKQASMTTDTQQQQTLNQQPKTLAERQADPAHPFKCGVRYLHPKHREIIMISGIFTMEGVQTERYSVRLNSGEDVEVLRDEVGPESQRQSMPCLGCGELTAPLGFYPRRRKCRRCVRREDRIRKGGDPEDDMDKFIRAIPFIQRLHAAITKSPDCDAKILSAGSKEEVDKVIDEILSEGAAHQAA